MDSDYAVLKRQEDIQEGRVLPGSIDLTPARERKELARVMAAVGLIGLSMMEKHRRGSVREASAQAVFREIRLASLETLYKRIEAIRRASPELLMAGMKAVGYGIEFSEEGIKIEESARPNIGRFLTMKEFEEL